MQKISARAQAGRCSTSGTMCTHCVGEYPASPFRSGRERNSLIKTNAGVRASLDAAIKGVRYTRARKHLTSSKL